MEALDFIKAELQNFILKFPKTKVKVEVEEDLYSASGSKSPACCNS